ncbi:hypothetical protein GGI00_001834 [Coemansia sp. RSA 2681]|nr:hypothetical protein GGI00_001834 [Coemansia sp. RSA 2681]
MHSFVLETQFSHHSRPPSSASSRAQLDEVLDMMSTMSSRLDAAERVAAAAESQSKETRKTLSSMADMLQQLLARPSATTTMEQQASRRDPTPAELPSIERFVASTLSYHPRERAKTIKAAQAAAREEQPNAEMLADRLSESAKEPAWQQQVFSGRERPVAPLGPSSILRPAREPHERIPVLPTLPTFGTELATEARNSYEYTNTIKVRLIGAGLSPDKEGYRAVMSTLDVALANVLAESCEKLDPVSWNGLEKRIRALWPMAASTHEIRLALSQLMLKQGKQFAAHVCEFDNLREAGMIHEKSQDAWDYFFKSLPRELRRMTMDYAQMKGWQPADPLAGDPEAGDSVKEIYAYVTNAAPRLATLMAPEVRHMSGQQFQRGPGFYRAAPVQEVVQRTAADHSQLGTDGHAVRNAGPRPINAYNSQPAQQRPFQAQQHQGNRDGYQQQQRSGNCDFYQCPQCIDQMRTRPLAANQVEAETIEATTDVLQPELPEETSNNHDDEQVGICKLNLDKWVLELDEENIMFFGSVNSISIEAEELGDANFPDPQLCQVSTAAPDQEEAVPNAYAMLTANKDGKWIIPAVVHVGDESCKVSMLLDSGALHNIISQKLVMELGCIITHHAGTISMVQVGSSLKCIGATTICITTLHHNILLEAEVFPGKTNLPIFFGVEILNRYGLLSLLAVLADREDHPLVSSQQPDIEELPAGDDSAMRDEMLDKLGIAALLS